MLIEDAYSIYLTKVEKNITNDGMSTDRGRFKTLWDDKQLKYYRKLLQAKGTDEIRYAERFLIPNFKLSVSSKTTQTYDFPTPKNFFDLGNVRALVSQGDCKNQEMFLIETNPENYSEYLRDTNTTPSFKWRESLFSLASEKISVFYNDFIVESLILSYYRYPNQITLLNPENPETDFNEQIPIEWEDKEIYNIIDMCVLEFDISENNSRINADAIRINN